MKQKDSHKGLKELQSNYKQQQVIATSWNQKKSVVGFQKQQLESIETRRNQLTSEATSSSDELQQLKLEEISCRLSKTAAEIN